VPPLCYGEVATIVGTPRNDTIHGTPGNDVIVGSAVTTPSTARAARHHFGDEGNDVIFAVRATT